MNENIKTRNLIRRTMSYNVGVLRPDYGCMKDAALSQIARP